MHVSCSIHPSLTLHIPKYNLSKSFPSSSPSSPSSPSSSPLFPAQCSSTQKIVPLALFQHGTDKCFFSGAAQHSRGSCPWSSSRLFLSASYNLVSLSRREASKLPLAFVSGLLLLTDKYGTSLMCSCPAGSS